MKGWTLQGKFYKLFINPYQMPFNLFVQLFNKYLLNIYCLLDLVVNKIGNTIPTVLGGRLLKK